MSERHCKVVEHKLNFPPQVFRFEFVTISDTQKLDSFTNIEITITIIMINNNNKTEITNT